MTADALDIAADRAELEREHAIRRHLQRAPCAAALREECREPAHVTPRGLTWRFCVECADEHLRRSQTA